jgi:hypothetical protein
MTAKTAETVIDRFKTAGLPVTDVVAYTAATDPDRLLGRPGNYLSKAAWVDARTGETLESGDGISQGGSVEVFATAKDAKARAKSVQKTRGEAKEYDYLNGPDLIRVSGKLTPDQAAAYGKAAGAKLYSSS